MKKILFGLFFALFAQVALATEYTIVLPFQPGSGQVTKASPKLMAGDVVKCTFRTTDNLNLDLAQRGNLFVTQPVGNAFMTGKFQGRTIIGNQSISWQFKGMPLRAVTDYTATISVDEDTLGIVCKLNSGPKEKVGR